MRACDKGHEPYSTKVRESVCSFIVKSGSQSNSNHTHLDLDLFTIFM